jgi:MFS family permease
VTDNTSDRAGSVTTGPVLVAVVMTQLLVVIDFFALNLTLPPMAHDFGVAVTDLQWVLSGYMIAVGAFMVPAGRIADILGRKRVMLSGVALFGAASAVCGAAPSEQVVIIFRVVQGIGAAMCFPVSIAVITATFPTARVQRSLGLVYGLAAMGNALGPLVGGLLSEISWRLVFWLNVPLAIVIVILGLRFIPENRDESAGRAIDWAGVVLVAGGLAVATFGVDQASNAGWGSAQALVPLGAGIGMLVAFVLTEQRVRQPLLDLALFRIRPYVVIVAGGAVANCVYVVAIFASSVYLQSVRGLSAAEAGLIFLSLSAGAAASGQLSGRLDKSLPQWVMAFALGLGGAALFVLTLSDAWAVYLPTFAVMGFGLGLGWAYASVGTQVVVPPNEAGVASGLTLTVLVSLGGVAIATASTVMQQLAGTPTITTDAPIDDVLRVAAAIAMIAAAIIPVAGHIRRDQLHLADGAGT